MTKKPKKRLDAVVQELHPQLTRNQIQSFIMQGKVLVDGIVQTKPGLSIAFDSVVHLSVEEPKYVSRAGFKLEAALDHFNVDVSGFVCMDAGISTGGFTDCLLQRGAARVYGIDVGYGQVHERIRNDKRVVLFEKTNLRNLEKLPELVDLVTLDVSFISILKVMPAVSKLIKPDGKIITLIKPQFEAERKDIKRGGVVKDAEVYPRVIEKIRAGLEEFGFIMIDVIDSPILGATSGNREFLALFKHKK